MLAQAIDSLPASYWKYFCIALIALLFAGSLVVTIIQAFRKPAALELKDKPPIEVRKAPKRYNHDATEIRFSRLEQIVERHDDSIGKINEVFRVDLPAMERRLDDANEGRAADTHKRINEILAAVGELRGEMKGKK